MAAAAATLAVPAATVATTQAERAGTFDAIGVGTIVAQGRFSAVFGSIQGPGVIMVRDPFGGAVVKLGAKRQRPRLVRTPAGRIVRVYAVRTTGDSFIVQGRGLRVELRSPKTTMSVSMFGRGSVTRLAGDGTYHLNNGTETPWLSAPLPLQIKPPPPVTRQNTVAAAAQPAP
jgi:hypothetical protein